MNTPLTSEFIISQQVLSQEVNGETVLLDLASENYFGLDETGTRFWQLAQKNNNLQQIIEMMLTEYEVEEEQLNKDLDELISRLVEAGLITVGSE